MVRRVRWRRHAGEAAAAVRVFPAVFTRRPSRWTGRVAGWARAGQNRAATSAQAHRRGRSVRAVRRCEQGRRDCGRRRQRIGDTVGNTVHSPYVERRGHRAPQPKSRRRAMKSARIPTSAGAVDATKQSAAALSGETDGLAPWDPRACARQINAGVAACVRVCARDGTGPGDADPERSPPDDRAVVGTASWSGVE